MDIVDVAAWHWCLNMCSPRAHCLKTVHIVHASSCMYIHTQSCDVMCECMTCDTHTHARARICTRTPTHHTRTHTHTYIHYKSICICIHTCIGYIAFNHVCIQLSLSIYICIYIYICMYIYIYINIKICACVCIYMWVCGCVRPSRTYILERVSPEEVTRGAGVYLPSLFNEAIGESVEEASKFIPAAQWCQLGRHYQFQVCFHHMHGCSSLCHSKVFPFTELFC